MSKRKNLVVTLLIWLTVVGAGAGGAAYLAMRRPAIDVTATKMSRGRVEQTVSSIASGTVKAGIDSRIASEIMGKIVSIAVQEGQHVEKGDLLIELNHEELDGQVRLAEANLAAGRAMGIQAQIGANVYEDVSATQVSQARAQMDQAEADFKRLDSLFRQNAVSQSDRDKAALAARVARESYQAALANQRQTQARQEEVRSSEANVEQLEAAVTVAKALLEKAYIRAPFSGVIGDILVDEGEAVTPGIPLVQLVEDSVRYVEAPFDEANAAELKLGQHARLSLDAYRETEFPGEVEYISPVVTVNPDLSRTLNVKVRVVENQDKFIPGMSADVVVLVDEKTDALFVPSEALVRQRYLYVIENGIARRREVKSGIGNWKTMEILDGVKEGETIVTSVSIKELQDGVKVNVVDELEEQ